MSTSNKNVNHFANMLLLMAALSAVTEDNKLPNTTKTNVKKEINNEIKKEKTHIKKEMNKQIPKHSGRGR